MHISGKIGKISGLVAVITLCIAIVAVIISGVNQFKTGSQLASINQVSNLSHLLVRQQAKLFSLMLVRNVKNDELIESLDAFSEEDFVIDAHLYSASGVLIAQSRNAQPFQPLSPAHQSQLQTQQIVEPIFAQQDLVGFLRVTFDMQYGQTTQRKVNELFHLLYGELIILFLAGGLFVSSFYILYRRRLTLVPVLPTDPVKEPRRQTQRFHSRRRAFTRK